MNSRLLAAAGTAALALAATPVLAQSTATPVVPGMLQSGTGCYPGQTTCFVPGTPLSPAEVLAVTFSAVGSPGTLSASTTTSNLALPANGSIVEIANGGSVTAYINLGVGSGTTATTSSMAIPAGQTVFIFGGINTYIAGITASSTATLTVTVGNPAAVSGGGGGGGNVTVTAGFTATTTEAAGTVTTHATFQSALASNSSRKGCTIQNTSTDIEYVFFGATGSATTSNAFALGAAAGAGGQGGSITCAIGGLGVATDNVAITSKTADGATYVTAIQ